MNATTGVGQLWHQMPVEQVLDALDSSAKGLSTAEAQRRLDEYGPNVLVQGKRRGPVGLLLAQFTDFMILILLAAAVISAVIGEVVDAIAIVAILVLNAVIGFIQEYRAERAMEALQAMAAPNATVLRQQTTVSIPAAEVVPGDVVLLEAGGIVPADLRLIEVAQLRIDESSLTGESLPVEKSTDPLDDVASLGDRRDMAYKGTIVTYGRATGVAVGTGMQTEFGKIATLLHQAGEVKTPLQRRLTQLGQRLSLAALAICAVVLIAGILRGEALLLMFLTAVSLAVAAIPEALPAVVTISLALGAKKMVQKQALVRKLPAVEALGSVTYICTDKTGTLTMNQMRVQTWHCDGTSALAPQADGPWESLLRAMALCSDIRLDASGTMVGDPTEVAMVRAAEAGGVDKHDLEQALPRLAELPFDSIRKCMTTLHHDPAGGVVAYTKGAAEVILACSVDVATSHEETVSLETMAAVSDSLAADGLRVLALAVRHWPALPECLTPEAVERDLTVLGLVGLIDPPRPEAREAVAMCKAAGIVPVMITGDHPMTARAIAQQLGILDEDAAVMTGDQLSGLSGAALQAEVKNIRVYARVSPEQKLDIVMALQERGELVAMTGDGVNDAPALKRADIGVAMGVTGTDVAKEASAMILLDDNFATIVRAVQEGRRIYDNVRRFVKYAVTTNSAEIWTMFLAPFLGLPLPLMPIQILWINLVTDSLPGLALAAEPGESNLMRRPPRPPQEGFFARGLGRHVLWVGPLMAAAVLGTQAWCFYTGAAHWQTMAFTVLCLSQLGHALAIRSERASLFTQGILSNFYLFMAVLLTFLLQMGTIYLPPLNAVFRTAPLTPLELIAALGISAVPFLAVEGEKWVMRRR